MIYRIRIMRLENSKLVFDRYATEMEMTQLRISSGGKVEKLSACEEYDNTWKKQGHTFPLHSCNNYYQTTVCGYWQDVSATHFVEWGLPNGIYQFNTYRCIKSVSSYSPIGTVFTAMFDDIISEFYLMSANDSVRLCSVADGFDSYFEYIGNVWGSKWS